MKRHIKNCIAIALCVSMTQPALNAGFLDSCRKWVARGAAVGYWGILGFSAIKAGQMVQVAEQLSQDIKKTDSAGNEYCPELKEVRPEYYREVNEIITGEGLPSLDKQKIRVISYEKVADIE